MDSKSCTDTLVRVSRSLVPEPFLGSLSSREKESNRLRGTMTLLLAKAEDPKGADISPKDQ